MAIIDTPVSKTSCLIVLGVIGLPFRNHRIAFRSCRRALRTSTASRPHIFDINLQNAYKKLLVKIVRTETALDRV
jgi:hypothetical protein